jgi:hypothetical protein
VRATQAKLDAERAAGDGLTLALDGTQRELAALAARAAAADADLAAQAQAAARAALGHAAAVELLRREVAELRDRASLTDELQRS